MGEHDGDQDDSWDDPEADVDPAALIEAASREVEHLRQQLVELQKQYLARGTNDVVEQARRAIEVAASAAADALKTLKKTN